MKNEIIVKVPATSANMGSGFDCIGIALDIWNTVKVKELSSSSSKVRISGYGEDTLPTNQDNLVLQSFNRYFHVELCVGKGIQPIKQDPDSIVYVRRELASQNDMELMGLHRVTTILGSVVIALAISRDEIDVDAAWQASIVDESFQIERWGLDDEDKKRRDINYVDYNAAVKFMHLNRL